MATPNTRSLHGATYVPINWNNNDDHGWDDKSRPAGFKGRNVYHKAAVFGYLLRNRPKSMLVIKALRQKYEHNGHGQPRATRRNQLQLLLDLAENYTNNRRYQELASAPDLAKAEPAALVCFVQDWMATEHALLCKALEDWKITAEEVIKTGTETSAAVLAKELGDVRKEMDRRFELLNSELANLREARERSAATASPEKDSSVPVVGRITYTPLVSVGNGNGQPAEAGEDGAAPAAASSTALPKAQIWRRMWNDTSRRESARYLALNFFASSNMMKAMADTIAIDSMAERLAMTDEQAVSIAENNWMAQSNAPLLLDALFSVDPVGYLFLERLDFTPVGFVKGELVYSLPLTPGESITVSHKEWSNTTEEYITTVETMIEEEREQALSEKSELVESTETEQEVRQKVEVTAEAGYEGAGWNVSLSGGYTGEWNSKQAANRSAKLNRDLTSKAASRSKKEHKLSFKVAREVHVEDEQVRTIQNNSDKPVRWDFHRLMQKWQIQLYQVDTRLTYDIVIPEPADNLLGKYRELERLTTEIEAGDPFNLTLEQVTGTSYANLASQYGADLEAPPRQYSVTLGGTETYSGSQREGYSTIPITIPEGYRITMVQIVAPNGTSTAGHRIVYKVPGDSSSAYVLWDVLAERNYAVLRASEHRQYDWVWSYHFEKDADHRPAQVRLSIEFTPTDEGWSAWRVENFNRLREAARTRWITRLEGLQARRDRLIEELTGKDSLKLRQMEREEIMKGVLRWMLGPDFEFYPSGLKDILTETSGTSLDCDELGYYNETGQLREEARTSMLQYGDEIRFLQEAIEWENVNWVMYPYFWTRPDRWSFKQSLDHPDFYHRSFLRGGCARVIVTIRPGFEEAWLKKMEGLDALPGDYPYLSLAKEIKNMAETQYAYTRNPNREELETLGELVDTWFEYTPTGALNIEEGGPLLDR